MNLPKKNFKFHVLALVALTAFLFSSCVQEPDFSKNEGKTALAAGFNFATSSTKALNISLKDMQDASVGGAVVEVYFDYPFDANGQKIATVYPVSKVLIVEQGTKTTLEVPSYLSELYLVTKFPGYASADTVKTTGKDLNAIIHPAGFGRRIKK